MKDEWQDEKTLIRTFSFDEWVERGKKESWDECYRGIWIKDEMEGVSIHQTMDVDCLDKLSEYLEGIYWEHVYIVAADYKADFSMRWRETPDIIGLNREIELMDYHFYPEKFEGKPEPFAVQMSNESLKNQITIVRKAYAKLLSEGRNGWGKSPEMYRDPLFIADCCKVYLDWLIAFKNYLSDDTPTAKAILDFTNSVKEDSNVVKELDEHEETIRSILSPLKRFIIRNGEYDKLVSWLVSYCNGRTPDIDKPVFLVGQNKGKLAGALSEIHNRCCRPTLTYEYLVLLTKAIEIFKDYEIDPARVSSSKLSKLLRSN